MNWLEIALAVLKAAPQIVALIVQIEQAFGAGNGAAKKAAVLFPLSEAPKPVLDFMDGYVDHIVAGLNAANKFQHAKAA